MRILQMLQLFQRRATPERTERIMKEHQFYKDFDEADPHFYVAWYHRSLPIEDQEMEEIQRKLKGAKVVRQLHKVYFSGMGLSDIVCVRVTIPW